MSTVSLYQFLGISGGGAVAGLLIAINASVTVGIVVVLVCVPIIFVSMRALRLRGIP